MVFCRWLRCAAVHIVTADARVFCSNRNPFGEIYVNQRVDKYVQNIQLVNFDPFLVNIAQTGFLTGFQHRSLLCTTRVLGWIH